MYSLYMRTIYILPKQFFSFMEKGKKALIKSF